MKITFTSVVTLPLVTQPCPHTLFGDMASLVNPLTETNAKMWQLRTLAMNLFHFW